MADEFFFALTLKGQDSQVWDPQRTQYENDQCGYKLIIKQALLGPEAVEGEVNVIQVEAMNWDRITKIPIAILTAGGPNNHVTLDLSFPDPPVTFSLIQGNGPVHILGCQLIEIPTDEPLDEEELTDEEPFEDLV